MQKLLKYLKDLKHTAEYIWLNHSTFKKVRESFREEKASAIISAVLKQDFSEFDEFSEEFYKVYDLASCFQDLIRIPVYEKFKDSSDFDEVLTAYAAKIASLYDKYFLAWARAMHNTKAGQFLRIVKEKYPHLLERYKDTPMYNHYTVNVLDSDVPLEDLTEDKAKELLQAIKFVPFAKYFSSELEPILKTWEELLAKLRRSKLSSEQKKVYEYLVGYKEALSCEEIDTLEKKWRELDILWLQFNYPIEIVHDIEYDYGDPLRIKIIPDFSIRFLDDSYSEYNNKIGLVKQRLVEFFSENFSGPILKNGLFALEHTNAGLYYLPFLSGMSLYFKFSGQSIPNRPDIKEKYGVKIYFDPIATRAREEKVLYLANKVLASKITREDVDALNAIVYHVAAHEFGHAIFGMRNHKSLSPHYAGLMEEWRAERVALNIMFYLYEKGDISEKMLEKLLFMFAMYDLRRFADFNSKTLRPYILSAIDAYNIYEELGYLKIVDGKLEVDRGKTIEVYKRFREELLTALNAINEADPTPIEELYESIQPGKLVNFLVEKLGA